MKFFLDACLSWRFAEFLSNHGIDAIHPLTDAQFKADMKDPIWIPKVCRQGRIILSSDRAQIKTKGKTVIELALIQRHRGRAFFFENDFPVWPIWKQTACFFKAWEKIIEMAPGMMLGDLYGVTRDAKVTQKHIQKVNV